MGYVYDGDLCCLVDELSNSMGNQTLSLEGNVLSISGGNSVVLPDGISVGISKFELNGTLLTLTLTNGATKQVDLSPLYDYYEVSVLLGDAVGQVTLSHSLSSINVDVRAFLGNEPTQIEWQVSGPNTVVVSASGNALTYRVKIVK